MTITATGAIILISVLASLYAWENQQVYQKWLFNPYLVKKNGEYHRFITSALIHSDYMHLIFNMITLYYLGQIAEQLLGSFYFVVLYVLGVIVADLPTYFKHQNHYSYNSIGASGGVSAVVFSGILFYPTITLCLFFVLCLPGFVLGILYLFYSAYMARTDSLYINHDAHLYGALFGIVFTILLRPAVLPSFIEQIINWKGFF